jgi:acetyltransferase-like isoleucine patch superfamily enzyme
VKHGLNVLAMVLVSPTALTCEVEKRLTAQSQGVFLFWTHVFALLPGLPGRFLRRGFYRWTLDRCAEDVTIEFGALFSRRNTKLERRVYIGPYAIIGSASIGENTLIGSRASLLSGGHQHSLLPSGEWSATVPSQLTRINIGRNTWIGEGAILMADTGEACMVAAGAVVSAVVPTGVMVAGNPARFVRRLVEEERSGHGVALSAVR